MLISGLSILIIGDSNLLAPDRLVNSLHNALTSQGAAVHTFGVCAAKPKDWITASPAGRCGGVDRVGKSPAKVLGTTAMTIPVKTLLANEHPNLLMIVLGDTLTGYEGEFPKVWAWEQVTALTKDITSTKTPCVWVGPAWGGLDERKKFHKTKARVEELSRFLSKNVSPCTFIDSTKMSNPGEWETTVDGLHLTAQGYKLWGEAIANSLK